MSKIKLTVKQPFHSIENNILARSEDVVIDHDNATVELLLTYAQEKRVTCQYDCTCGVELEGYENYMLFIERKEK